MPESRPPKRFKLIRNDVALTRIFPSLPIHIPDNVSTKERVVFSGHACGERKYKFDGFACNMLKVFVLKCPVGRVEVELFHRRAKMHLYGHFKRNQTDAPRKSLASWKYIWHLECAICGASAICISFTTRELFRAVRVF
jgi:hypothetical protein